MHDTSYRAWIYMFFKMLEYVPKKWQNMPLSRNCILNDSLIDFYCNYDWITISTTVAERPVTCLPIDIS